MEKITKIKIKIYVQFAVKVMKAKISKSIFLAWDSICSIQPVSKSGLIEATNALYAKTTSSRFNMKINKNDK